MFNVDVKDSFSFFETESKFVDNFLAINNQDVDFNGRKMSLEVSHRKMRDGAGNSGDGERRGGFKSGGGFKGGDKRDGGKRPRKPGNFSSERGSSFGGEKKRSFGKSRF
jgi:ATP-dependent RNA helicase DeaD